MKAFNYTVGSCSSPTIKALHSPVVSGQQTKHNDYGTLSKAVSKHLKKKKRKDSIRVQLQMQNTIRRQIQNQQRCHSMDKLVTINREKNQQIKRFIYEKAALESTNEELKAMMLGPTQREQDLHRKINELEVQIFKMRSEYQQKELKYKQQIEQLKRQHRKEINELTDRHEHETNRLKMTINTSNVNNTVPVQNRSNYQYNLVQRTRSNSPSRFVNVYSPSATVNYATRQESPPKKSQYQNVQTIPVKRYNQNQNSYTNVFSQNSIRSQNQQISSPQREVLQDNYAFQKQDRNLSPNTTKNTTLTTYRVESSKDVNGPINPVRAQLERTGLSSQEYNSSMNKGQAQPYQYRNISQKQETKSNSNSRPATFGSKQVQIQQKSSTTQANSPRVVTQSAREGTSGVTTKDIDDICKRYYLND